MLLPEPLDLFGLSPHTFVSWHLQNFETDVALRAILQGTATETG